jgi:hypothetical protein
VHKSKLEHENERQSAVHHVVVLTVALSIDANSAALVDPGIQVEIGKYSVNENAGAVTVAVIRGWDEDFADTCLLCFLLFPTRLLTIVFLSLCCSKFL